MKTVDLIIDDKIKCPPDKETSAKTFRAGARCFSGGFLLRGGYQIGDFYEFLQIIVFGQHIQNIASFFGTFYVSLPFAGPLSDKLGRRISVLIGAASYVIFFIGIAFSPNVQVAYVAAVLGGIAIGILGVLAIFAPMPAGNAAAKSESFISSLKNANFSVESIALILITSIATFQLWLNCAQTFGKEIAGIPSASVSMMQTYYSAGAMVALVVTSLLIIKFKQVRFLVIYPAISVVMLVLVYLVKTPMICFVGVFVIGYAAAGGVLQMATATVNDLSPNIKGTITSLVMIASSLCNYTILSAAAKMSSMQVIMMNIVITVIGVLLAVFVNVGYGSLLAKTEQ